MVPKKTVLVIDDEQGFLEILEARLGEEYHVLCAADGKEGFEKALAAQPDIILLDILMPKLDGYELLKKLKSSIRTRNIPVLMLTTVAESEAIYKAKDLGITDYLIKPLHLEALPGIVKRYI